MNGYRVTFRRDDWPAYVQDDMFWMSVVSADRQEDDPFELAREWLDVWYGDASRYDYWVEEVGA